MGNNCKVMEVTFTWKIKYHLKQYIHTYKNMQNNAKCEKKFNSKIPMGNGNVEIIVELAFKQWRALMNVSWGLTIEQHT